MKCPFTENSAFLFFFYFSALSALSALLDNIIASAL